MCIRDSLAAVQEVDLVKPLPVAHFHDFALEIFHSGVGAAVLDVYKRQHIEKSSFLLKYRLVTR